MTVRLELTPEELNMTPEELRKLSAEIETAVQYIKELGSQFEI